MAAHEVQQGLRIHRAAVAHGVLPALVGTGALRPHSLIRVQALWPPSRRPTGCVLYWNEPNVTLKASL